MKCLHKVVGGVESSNNNNFPNSCGDAKRSACFNFLAKRCQRGCPLEKANAFSLQIGMTKSLPGIAKFVCGSLASFFFCSNYRASDQLRG